MIKESLSSGSIESVYYVIDFLIDREGKGKANEIYREEIFDYLTSNTENRFNVYPYTITGRKYGLAKYVCMFLYHYLSEKSLKKQAIYLHKQRKFIDQFYLSQNPIITKATCEKLFNRLSEFGFNLDLLRDNYGHALNVYVIPYESEKLNGAYSYHLNSIALYRAKQKNTPEYILLHEIGHVLQFRLTNDGKKVPESFLTFNKRYNPNWKGDLVEVFVDLFSIAIMMDSPFSNLNPFTSTFSSKHQAIIKDYFIELVGSVQ